MLRYRDAERNDFAEIARFPESREEAFYMYPRGLFPLTSDQLEEAAAVRHLPTVVEVDGQAAGYANFYDLEPGERCWVGNVILRPNLRGSGIGRFLLETMQQRARQELHVKELHLVCHNTNTRALLFYQKLGYRPYDIKPMTDYTLNAIAGIKMRMEL
jgi:ribosomal protein S18 acetylase RimI-like enzyme